MRLNPFENAIKDAIAINVEPRANFQPEVAMATNMNLANNTTADPRKAQGVAGGTPGQAVLKGKN